jgi:hypothetical protein
MRLSIDYEWMDAGRESGEGKKGR